MSKWTLNDDGTYTDLEYTNFPAQCDNWPNSEDISESMIAPANQYRKAMENGEYSSAQAILDNLPRLRNMLINADTINRLKHSIMALERMFTDTIEPYIKKFTDAAKTSADNAASSAAAAATSEANAQTHLNEVQSLKESAESFRDAAANSAKSAQESVNYVQQHVGGYYNTYYIAIDPSAWKETPDGPTKYQCSIDCADATEDRIPMGNVVPADVPVAVTNEMYMSCSTGNGTVTFYADKSIPSEIHVQLTLFSKTA